MDADMERTAGYRISPVRPPPFNSSNGKGVVIVNPRVKKVILVVGTTGTGKSTLVNIMFNSTDSINVDEKSCTTPCLVKNTTDSVTKKSGWFFSPSDGKVYIDTIGMGDPNKATTEIALDLKSLLKEIGAGVHAIVVVLKFGRITKEERLNLEFISDVFDPNWKNGCIVVATHYDGEIGDEAEKQAVKQWLKGDKTMTAYFSKIRGGIVLTDNSLGRDFDYNECVRIACARKLKNFADSCEQIIGPKPINWKDLIMFYMEKWFRINKVVATAKHLNDILQYLQNFGDVGAGTCPICEKEMIDLQKTATTDCHHHFHFDCLMKILSNTYSRCLVCQKQVAHVYQIRF